MVAKQTGKTIYKTVDKKTQKIKTHKNTHVTHPTLNTCDVQSHLRPIRTTYITF